MIAIVDYGAGNLGSVKRACEAVGAAAEVVSDPAALARAERIIFPGVGHAAAAMQALRDAGLEDALITAFDKGTPILAICLGAQLVLDRSEEGGTAGMEFVWGSARRFQLDDPALPVPHVGWNEVQVTQAHPLLAGLCYGDRLYFSHSYYPATIALRVYATTHYGIEFASAFGHRNLFAAQFHPEKSGPRGLDIIRRFSTWDGTC